MSIRQSSIVTVKHCKQGESLGLNNLCYVTRDIKHDIKHNVKHDITPKV